MIIDAQIHVWEADRPDRPWPKAGAQERTSPQRPQPLTAAEALLALDSAGVDRAILVPPSWEGDRNDVALRAVADHPRRFAVMGRIPPDPEFLDALPRWRDPPGMLGARLILSDGDPRVAEGPDHPFWHEAARARLPLMLAPAGKMPLLAAIARRHPTLPIIVDHMGARVHKKGAEAFAQLASLLALADADNVAVKATCLPDYSNMQAPWDDVMPFLKSLFDAFGAERTFWGSDLSRLPCPYPLLVRTFRADLPWLRRHERDLVMGEGIAAWLDWR